METKEGWSSMTVIVFRSSTLKPSRVATRYLPFLSLSTFVLLNTAGFSAYNMTTVPAHQGCVLIVYTMCQEEATLLIL